MVTASPVPDSTNELPLIRQQSEESGVDQYNAFILKSIANYVKDNPGKYDEQEINDDALEALREILINEANFGDDSDSVKVQQISKNNSLEHINKELQENLIEAENKDPENVLRSDNLNNEIDSEDKNISFEQPDDQYKLKLTGYEPHIADMISDSDEGSNSQLNYNSGDIEKKPPTNQVKKLFDSRFLRIPQVPQYNNPVEF